MNLQDGLPDGVTCHPIEEESHNFVFSPVLSGNATASVGEIINGSAGQVCIDGNGNTFIQGVSSSSATAGGGGDHLA